MTETHANRTVTGSILTLFRYGIKDEIGRFRRAPIGQKIVFFVVSILIPVGLSQLAWLIGRSVPFLRVTDLADYSSLVLIGAFSAAGIVLLLAALPLGVATISRAEELTLLFSLPFKLRDIFAYKLTVAAIWESGLTVALLLPLAIGLGIANGAGIPYYLAAVGFVLIAPVLPLAIGLVAAFGLLRVFNIRTVRAAIGILGALLGGAWYFTRLAPTRRFPADLSQGLAQLGGGPAGLNPFGWPGQALGAALTGDAVQLSVFGGLSIAVAAGSFVAAIALASGIARSGWLDFSIQPRRAVREKDDIRKRAAERRWGWSPERAFIIKDWKLIQRDPLLWSRFLAPFAAFGFVFYQLLRLTAGLSGPFADTWRLAAVITSISFLAWNLNNRLGLSAFNRDRGAIVWTLMSPTPLVRIISGKLIMTLLPQLLVLVPLGVWLAVSVGLTPENVSLAGVSIFALIVILGSITLAVAARFPKFDWKNERRLNPWPAIAISSLLQMSATVLIAGLAAGASALGSETGDRSSFGLEIQIAGALSTVVVAVVSLALVRWYSRREIARWEIYG